MRIAFDGFGTIEMHGITATKQLAHGNCATRDQEDICRRLITVEIQMNALYAKDCHV